MKTVILICGLLMISPCLSDHLRRFCASGKTMEIGECIVEADAEIGQLVDRVSRDCLKDFRPVPGPQDEKVKVICDLLKTEEGEGYLKCFNGGLPAEAFDNAEKCLQRHGN